jgi:hypothetical protein
MERAQVAVMDRERIQEQLAAEEKLAAAERLDREQLAALNGERASQ